MRKIIALVALLLMTVSGFSITARAENTVDIKDDDPVTPEYAVTTRTVNKTINASYYYSTIDTTVHITYNVYGTVDIRTDTNQIVSHSLSYSLVNKWYSMPATNHGNLDIIGFSAECSGGTLYTKVNYSLVTYNPSFLRTNEYIRSIAASY